MSISGLYGLKRPERRADVNIEDDGSKEAFKMAYEAWKSATKEFVDMDVTYREACRITKPIADKLTDAIMCKKLDGVIKKECEKELFWGFFISAIYNQSSRRELVWDMNTGFWDTPKLRKVAYRLPADKTFVNRGKVDEWMGAFAEGSIINYGECHDSMGFAASGNVINFGYSSHLMGGAASGNVINCGKTSWGMGYHASGNVINFGKDHGQVGDGATGIVINFNDPKSFVNLSSAKLVLNEDEYKNIPELVAYFDGLKAVLDEDKDNDTALSKLPDSKKMTADVEAILKKRGYLRP